MTSWRGDNTCVYIKASECPSDGVLSFFVVIVYIVLLVQGLRTYLQTLYILVYRCLVKLSSRDQSA